MAERRCRYVGVRQDVGSLVPGASASDTRTVEATVRSHVARLLLPKCCMLTLIDNRARDSLGALPFIPRMWRTCRRRSAAVQVTP